LPEQDVHLAGGFQRGFQSDNEFAQDGKFSDLGWR
jgi:hypothetical protein